MLCLRLCICACEPQSHRQSVALSLCSYHLHGGWGGSSSCWVNFFDLGGVMYSGWLLHRVLEMMKHLGGFRKMAAMPSRLHARPPR